MMKEENFTNFNSSVRQKKEISFDSIIFHLIILDFEQQKYINKISLAFELRCSVMKGLLLMKNHYLED